MFSYEKVTEKEAEESRSFPLLEEGIYNFEVLSSEFQMSKSGNPMIKMKLVVWDNNGKEHVLFDYLLSNKQMGFKTRHFCYAVGLEEHYESGSFNETHCQGMSGKAYITIQKGKQKDDGTFYKDRNVVEDYIVNTNEAQKELEQKAKEFFNDDVTL